MPSTSDLNQYWLDRGKDYMANELYRLSKPFHREQEALVTDLVRHIAPKRVFEIGCGFGRVTRAIGQALPEVDILATDLSEDQVRVARRHCAGLGNVRIKPWDFYSASQPTETDLVLAIEVILHVPPARLGLLATLLLATAPVLLHDYDPGTQPGDRTSEHCFAHDFDATYGAASLHWTRLVHGVHALMLVERATIKAK